MALHANVALRSDSAAVEAAPGTRALPQAPDEACFASTICAVKDRVRWRTPAWKPEFCEEVARGVLKSSERHQIPPALILAVMINESDMNENAFRTTVRDGAVYAKDGGLMGIRCIVDKQGRCTNGNVRGLAWKEVMEPINNIELGARELGRWREGGGLSKVTTRVRDADGKITVREHYVPCEHKTHAYWAHYNHGPRYIDHGSARHYPHRIAVLYYALARAMDIDTSEITKMRLTMVDPGKRPRTADRPVEARYQKLCQQIRDVGSACGGLRTAALGAHADAN
jgi:hypothetical protein